MNQEKENFTKMLMEVGTTVEIVGVERLTELLKDIQKIHKDITYEQHEEALKVILVTSKNYDMTFDDFFSKKRKNDRRFALGTVCFILNKKLNFDANAISLIVKKGVGFVYFLIKEIEEMDKNHPVDKKILNKIENILQELKIN